MTQTVLDRAYPTRDRKTPGVSVVADLEPVLTLSSAKGTYPLGRRIRRCRGSTRGPPLPDKWPFFSAVVTLATPLNSASNPGSHSEMSGSHWPSNNTA